VTVACLLWLPLVRLLVEGRLSSRSAGHTMYVIGQAGDCGSGVKLARVVARQRGYREFRIVPVLLHPADSASDPKGARRVGAQRTRVLVWTLWLRGLRSTPVLVEYSRWRPLGRYSILVSPRNAGVP